MKKTAVIVLFILPILAFAIIAISGIIVNETKYVNIETISIESERINFIGETTNKYILIRETDTTIQLTYRITPANPTDPTLIWEIKSGFEFVEINQYGVITILKSGGEAIVSLHNKNNTIEDTVRIIVRY